MTGAGSLLPLPLPGSLHQSSGVPSRSSTALFLEKFVGERTWVHLDIAGSGRSETDAGENIKGGTGFGARLLIEWLASF